MAVGIAGKAIGHGVASVCVVWLREAGKFFLQYISRVPMERFRGTWGYEAIASYKQSEIP